MASTILKRWPLANLVCHYAWPVALHRPCALESAVPGAEVRARDLAVLDDGSVKIRVGDLAALDLKGGGRGRGRRRCGGRGWDLVTLDPRVGGRG